MDSAPTPAAALPMPLDRHATFEPWSDPWIDSFREEWLTDATARRAALVASLVAPGTHYATARLESYELREGGWSSLPEWAPPATPVSSEIAQALARGEAPTLPDDATSLVPERTPTTDAEWIALGRRVFFELPLRSEPAWESALRDPELGARVGIVFDTDGSAPGLVLLRGLDARTHVGITCALCHTAPASSGTALVPGRARRTLDYGLVRIESALRRGAPLTDENRARWASWGPGRADVLEERSEVPIAIPDLYALRSLRWLSQGAILRHDSPLALAVRQETQYIQANHLRTRPPRVLMWALVRYLYSIEPPALPDPRPLDPRGAALFEEHCARCHSTAIGSGEPVAVGEVGTNRELAMGRARGTGHYRPSPLLRVADAAPYLHHGAVPSLEALLDPERTEPGHRFGSALSEAERGSLVAWLRAR